MQFVFSYYKFNNKRKVALTVFRIFLLSFIVISANAQTLSNKEIDLKLSRISADTSKLDSLLIWSEYSMETSILDAIQIGKKGKALAIDLGEANWIARFDAALGKNFTDYGNQDSALYHFNKAIQFYESKNSLLELADIHNKQVRLFINSGNFDKAYIVGNKALRIYESLDQPSLSAKVLLDLSDVLYYQERYQEGLAMANQALKTYTRLSDKIGIIQANQYLSDICIGLGKYEQALTYIDEALALQRTAKDDFLGTASILNTKGNVLKYLKKYELGLTYYQESRSIAIKVNHLGGIAATNANIADIYMRMGKFNKALPIILESISLQEKSGFTNNLVENYRHASEAYQALSNTEKSFFYYKKFTATKDSIFSIEKDKIISELKVQYESDKSASMIALQNQEIAQQKTTQLFFIGFLTLLGLLFALFYRNYINKHRLNSQLRLTNDKLDAKNQQNELLLKEIHHRVKNNLEIVSSLLALQSRQLDDQGAKSAMQESQNRVQSMGIIHQKLYQSKNLAAVEMKDYFSNLGEGVLDSFGKSEQVKIRYTMQELELDVDTAVPIGLIVNELLTNALKYAFVGKENPEIQIQLERFSDKSLKLNVSDNGIGKADNEMAEGTGFGSQLVQLLTEQLEGVMNYAADQGSHFTFHFKSNS
jgi:two-component sensor histidine kinase